MGPGKFWGENRLPAHEISDNEFRKSMEKFSSRKSDSQ